jgi:hypothetical protein
MTLSTSCPPVRPLTRGPYHSQSTSRKASSTLSASPSSASFKSVATTRARRAFRANLLSERLLRVLAFACYRLLGSRTRSSAASSTSRSSSVDPSTVRSSFRAALKAMCASSRA